MSEIVKEKTVFTLLEVMESIRRTLGERYGSPFWVKAEMNKLNHYLHSGHCYPELLEKREGKVVAQIKANLWREDYLRINDNFLRVLKEPLKEGIFILFLARVSFDPLYGLSLRILEIDPVFSLGELEREKQETIDRLRKEGIFDANKQRKLAMIPQRIAVISVETSKGWADFRKMIDGNAWGYCFFTMLFPSLLQGEKVTESILRQLERIRLVQHHFDAVAIIRGGGGDIGLAGYNRYELARQIALFPLPVITGIGHATNETVTEMVSFRNCITPTDLAGFLIQQFHNVSVPVKDAQEIMVRESRQYLSLSTRHLLQQASGLKGFAGFLIRGSREALARNTLSLRAHASRLTTKHLGRIEEDRLRVGKAGSSLLQEQNTLLSSLIRQVELLDPLRILARGYSITRIGRNVIRDAGDVNQNDILETTVYKGTILSKVNKIKKNRTS